MLKKTVFLALAFALANPLLAFDKDKLVEHVRKSMNESPDTQIEVGDLETTEFDGITAVPLTIRSRRGGGTHVLYLNKAGDKYILGSGVFDLNTDPDEERMKMIDLDGAPSKGSAKAPVTIVEYSDLQCGFCKKAHQAFEEELYKTYSKKDVRLVFKHFPLSFHKWAEDGAVATVCAREQKKDKAFWEMTNALFDESRSLTPENVKEKSAELAKKIGLNKEKFEACLESPAALAQVQEDKKEGSIVGVSSTPTFFINGRLQRGFRDFETFKAVIDGMLAEAKKK